MLITSLDFSFTGRIAIGRLERCFKRRNANLISKRDGTISKSRKELHTFEGLGRKKSTEVMQEIFVQLLV
jgi:GTP-binding protein